MKILNLLILLLLSLFAKSQANQFYKYYDIKTQSDFQQTSDIVLTKDSNFVITCVSSTPNNTNFSIELFKISSSGVMIWHHSFPCSSNNTYYANVVETPDSGFVISATYYYAPDLTTRMIMISTDKFGNKQWVKLIGNYSHTCYDMQIKGNSVFLLSQGSSWTGTSYQNGYFITKVDLLGNLQWFKSFNWIGNSPYPKTIVVNNNKDIFVAGEVLDSGFNYFGMSKIDSSGNLVWSKYYTPTGMDIDAKDMMIDQNGDLVLTGHSWVSNLNQWDIFLMKLDPAGNFKWGRTYGGSDNDEGWSIFQTGQDYMICAEPESFGASRASLIKTDSTGNIKWAKIYGDSTGSFPNGAVQLNDGFVIYGIKGTYSSNSNIYLLKTDRSGFALCKWKDVSLPMASYTLTSNNAGSSVGVPGFTAYNLTEVVAVVNDHEECFVVNIVNGNDLSSNSFIYPNPASTKIVFQLDNIKRVQLYNSFGKLVREEFYSSKNDLNIADLPNGIYFVEVQTDSFTGSQRLIIQH